MNKDEIINIVSTETEKLLVQQPAHFLVEIKIKPTNNIKVYIDGDKGVGIDDLVKYNRSLYKILEEKELFPAGDFSLEVSSPGLDEPLKMQRQYVKNIGREMEVELLDGKIISGKLLSVNDNEMMLEEIKGKARPTGSSGRAKKAETLHHTILLETIKKTYIKIKF